jgi:hypothetical protein
MTDRQSKLCSPRTANVTTYFLERAKHYRFTAAMTENTREIERLCEVAYMFEQMAHDTRRLVPHSRLTAGTWPRRRCSMSAGCKAGFIETWVGRVARLRRRLRQGAGNGCGRCCSSHLFERLSGLSRPSTKSIRTKVKLPISVPIPDFFKSSPPAGPPGWYWT